MHNEKYFCNFLCIFVVDKICKYTVICSCDQKYTEIYKSIIEVTEGEQIMTFNKLFIRYTQHEVRVSTLGTAYSRCASIKKYFLSKHGTKEPLRVTYRDINAIYEEMRQNNVAQNTIYGLYMALRSFFKYIIKIGATRYNPADDAEHILPKLKNKGF